MTPITLIMAYYDNPQMLQLHYDHLRALPEITRKQIKLIVVDDCSPRWPAKYGMDLGLLEPMKLFRMDTDVPWNQDACRNVGVREADTEFVLLTDMDHMVPIETWRTLHGRKWDSQRLYSFRRVSAPEMEPYKWHPNTWFLSKALYEKAGGYDERFAGYYGTDGDFARRVKMHTSNKDMTPLSVHVVRIPTQIVPDASTTTLQRKRPEDKQRIAALAKERGTRPTVRYRFPFHPVQP